MKSLLSRRLVLVQFALFFGLSFTAPLANGQTKCGQFDTQPVGDGSYTIQNNRWGSTAPECINITGASFTVTQSQINNPTNDKPGGYPSIFQGCHFAEPNCTNSGTTILPWRVNSIASASSSWDTTQAASSMDAYDVAYDIWFNSSANVTTSTPDGTELMIWLNKQDNNIFPAGGLDPTSPHFSNANANYDVWVDPPKQGVHNWKIITYVLTSSNNASITKTRVDNFDILAFINDAINNHHYIDPSSYLISVEAGFEIWRGGNGLTSNSFSFNAVSGTNSGMSGILNIWWPADGSLLSGTQPFKARLENIPLSSYSMYWAVDGGQQNLMGDNTAGGDHKESSVDLSGWTWRDAGDKWGPFSVNFIAKDSSGTVLQQKAVNIYVAKSLNIWWPTDGSVLSGTQPFKARLENVALSTYRMYWSVDGGQLNLMSDNTVGGDHKEASVDLSGWTWRDAGANYGPFSVTFTAQDLSGASIKTRTITIYRAK